MYTVDASLGGPGPTGASSSRNYSVESGLWSIISASSGVVPVPTPIPSLVGWALAALVGLSALALAWQVGVLTRGRPT